MKTIIALILFSLPIFSQEKLDVYFDFDKYDLNDATIKKINSWIAIGKNYEVVKLYGFCDWKGTNLYNDTLALKRVNMVYNFLKKSKITVKNDIEIRGFGENFEQSKIQDENRRVTIIYEEVKKKIVEDKVVPVDEREISEKIKTAKKGEIVKLDKIYFYNNSAKYVPSSQNSLYELLCAMNDNPNLVIEIQGHICCKSPNQVDVISEARAKTIYNYLIRNKINRKRMSYKGYGVSRPIHPIPEKNAQEEDENRRVEIMIVEN